MLNQTFNPNLTNSYLRPPLGGPPPNLPQMQAANQQAFLQRFPHLNVSTMGQGAIPKTPTPPPGSQNPMKPPPGLPNPLSNFRTAPEVTQAASATVSQPAKQSAASAVSQASPSHQQKLMSALSQASSPSHQQKLVSAVPQASPSHQQKLVSAVSQPQSAALPPNEDTASKAKAGTSSSGGLESFGASVSSSTSKSSLGGKRNYLILRVLVSLFGIC